MTKHPIHPLARAVPPMTGEEYAALVEDIRVQGQLEPVVLYESAILDGIHRSKACAELGIAVKTKEYHGLAPAAFVIAMNVRRRHLSVGQQAATGEAMVRHYRSRFPADNGGDATQVARDLGLERLPERSGSLGGTSPVMELVAKAVGIPAQAIETFSTLRKQAPILAQEVAAGTKALYAADAERKAAAKPSSERTGGDSEAESIEKDCHAYLAAIRNVAAIQNRLVEKRPKRKKEFLAGVQDKIERVASAGKRWMETL